MARVSPSSQNNSGKLESDAAKVEQIQQSITVAKSFKINDIEGIVPSKAEDGKTLRYPHSPGITDDTDYVMFEFYKYKPPYRNRGGSYTNADSFDVSQYADTQNLNDLVFGTTIDYNDAAQYADTQRAEGYNNILMYMPEDISTGFRAQWGGKNITNAAANILRSAGASGFDKIKGAGDTLTNAVGGLAYMAGARVIREFVQATGGDSLSNDDVFGLISGAVLNPNTELLFSGVDMRNFQLNFKLVPRNAPEAAQVNAIVAHFKKASLPDRVPEKIFGSDQEIKRNFIGVPKLVRVSFMSGSSEHKQLPKFKMCAITQVDVNYTPDGVYATYDGGQPVAMTLSIGFQETKICFSDELDASGVGGLR